MISALMKNVEPQEILIKEVGGGLSINFNG